MALKKKVSFEVFLDDNDKDEINQLLPQLVKRKLVKQDDLNGEWFDLSDEDFLELLKSFNLSFAKEVDDNWNADEEQLSDIPGFSDAINDIDDKVSNYIRDNNIAIKATDFEDYSDLDDWFESYSSIDIISTLLDVLWDNRGNPLADKIIQAIAKN